MVVGHPCLDVPSLIPIVLYGCSCLVIFFEGPQPHRGAVLVSRVSCAMPTTAPQSTDAAELAQILQFVYKVLVFVRSSSVLKLFACLLVDGIGFSSFLLPGVGELGDVGWAPLQAWFLYFMFGSVRMSGLGFMEEILPGTDFVPSASIAWASENMDGPTLDALRTLTGVALRQR